MLAYRLYCELPFGRLDHRNPRVQALAVLLGRSPSSVAVKLVNFAHLDPAQQARGIRGMGHVSALDRDVAATFQSNWDSAVEETSRQWVLPDDDEVLRVSGQPTEREATVKVRLTQQFFRRAVLAAYDAMCCVCGISTRD
jgi:putative restriction endonuclease